MAEDTKKVEQDSSASGLLSGDNLQVFKPTLFIGLGGTGYKVLNSLKKLIKKSYGQDIPFFGFLSIDTRDNKDQENNQLKDEEMLATSKVNVAREYGKFLEHMDTNFPDIACWMPPVKQWTKFQNKTLAIEGADQCRAMGRSLLHLVSGQARQRINGLLANITKGGGVSHLTSSGLVPDLTGGVNVYVVSSLCGGTGSGQFIDLAYLCRKIGFSYGVSLHSILAMPNLFPKTSGTEDVRGNAYAALKELDYYMSGGAYKMNYPFGQLKFNQESPFKSVYLVDSPNVNGASFEHPEAPFLMISQALYGLTASRTKSLHDEFETNVASVNNGVMENLSGSGFKTCYSGLGAAILKFPRQELAEIFCLQMAHNLIEQITRGVDESQNVDKHLKRLLLRLDPKTLHSDLTDTCQDSLNSVAESGHQDVLGVAEKEKIKQLDQVKSTFEGQTVPSLKGRILAAFDELAGTKPGDDSTLDALEQDLAAIINSKHSPLNLALKVVKACLSRLSTASEAIEQRVAKAEAAIGAEANAFQTSRSRIKELCSQGFFRDLLDWDKNDELDRLSRTAITALKNQAQGELEADAFRRIQQLYTKVTALLEGYARNLPTLIAELDRQEAMFAAEYSEKLETLIKGSPEKLEFCVISETRAIELYQKFKSENYDCLLENTLIRIPPVQWHHKFFEEGKDPRNYFVNSIIAPEVKKFVDNVHLLSELNQNPLAEQYLSSLISVSNPYIRCSLAIQKQGGSSIKNMAIIGMPDSKGDHSNKVFNKLRAVTLGDTHKAALTSTDMMVVLSTQHGHPVFALAEIESLELSCRLTRSMKSNPCYTNNDNIIADMKDLTPKATGAAGIYHRAVHAFDLGAMTGFLVKKPKGAVYYLCSKRQDLSTGITISGGRGGGRIKTKMWLAAQENRSDLERLEASIQKYLIGLDRASYSAFMDDWKTFEHKARASSRTSPEWVHPDDKQIRDYPATENLPKLLQDIENRLN